VWAVGLLRGVSGEKENAEPSLEVMETGPSQLFFVWHLSYLWPFLADTFSLVVSLRPEASARLQ
jgi:hypothetical protein